MNVSLFHRTAGAFLALALVLVPVSSGIAGTTGQITGTVLDSATHAPVAGAAVTAVSPSQVATVTSDSAGRFTFISLSPDTYTISARKTGYDDQSVAGISVFADQSQSIAVNLQKSLKQIAHVTSRSSLSPVRPGTGTDVYSVNPEVTQATATLGGGGGMNTAYSAIASMPGAYVPPNQVGVNQTVYIRGGYYDQIGFEYDGVPVNRSFDNYPSSGLTTLGQQELQIYTGGGEADANATGLGGFINQVIKTGTYPGYGTGGLAFGTPTFYHDARIEVGGASPDRLFSYYVGLSGSNQDFRYFDQFNGASLTQQIPYGYYPSYETTFLPFWPAVYPTCKDNTTYANPAAKNFDNDPGCFGSFPSNYGQPSTVDDREVVGNVHVGIPHKKDSGRDDVQLLYMSSATFTQYYSSVDDAGPLGLGIINSGTIGSYSNFYAGNTNQWGDFYTYPGSTKWLAPASTAPIAYYYPGSPGPRCANQPNLPNSCPVDAQGFQETVQIPNDYRDGRWDTANIFKLQYQKNIGSNAYLRLFGYTFYSETNRGTANGWGNAYAFGVSNYQYDVDSHTRGLELEFADQISSTNMVSGMLSYMTSNTLRYYNHNYDNTGSLAVSNFTDGNNCYATKNTKRYPIGHVAPCNRALTQGSFGNPYGNFDEQDPCANGDAPANSPACRNGAAMDLTFLGNTADYNTVTPKIGSGSIEDQWRPTDRWNINAALRWENDAYGLADTNNAATNFWFRAARREFCVNPVTRQPIFYPQPPQYIYFYQPLITFNCPVDNSTGTPVQTVHPNGTDGILLTNNYPSAYSLTYFLPRFSATYTASPDTVFRASVGRYAQQPQNYEIQYVTAQPNLASSLLGFIPFGFSSPLHEAQAQFSNNYDFSWEQHIRNTDVAFKITPYYRWGTNQLYETVNLPSLGVSPSFNAGTLRVDGIEFELTKGDFGKNGLAGIFSYTYTNAAEKWGNYPNSTVGPVDQYNQDIQEFNALTQAGGGAPCYAANRTGTPKPTCPKESIRNPYYSMSPQPLFGAHDWYTPGLDFPYLSPNTFSLVLNYRHGKFAFTPAMSLQEGTTYGTPADVQGMDPRSCYYNQRASGIPSSTPQNADYTSCSHALTSDGTTPGYLYIPNPQTGTFDSFGQFRQPWQFNMGAQMSYDVTPRITAKMVVANIVNTCFGGSSTPWTRANPPNGYTCAYTSNTFYNGGNFYQGTSPYDLKANGVPENPYFAQSFVPSYGDPFSGNFPLALNLYFSLNVKL